MSAYRHTQVGWAVILPILVVLGVTLGNLVLTPNSAEIILWVTILLAVVLSLFATLTVTVTDDEVECRFGVGLIRRRIHLSQVQNAAVVRNKWYYGWGIRLTPGGWLWNVSGLDAVELTFKNGKKFRIGTDEPDRLLQALPVGIGHGPSGTA